LSRRSGGVILTASKPEAGLKRFLSHEELARDSRSKRFGPRVPLHGNVFDAIRPAVGSGGGAVGFANALTAAATPRRRHRAGSRGGGDLPRPA
jgi:hypothetical protein